MKKILIIFGTRPEAIKLCPLIIELKRYKDIFKTAVCVTAQHRGMLDQVLTVFGVVPDYDLNIMKKAKKIKGLLRHFVEQLKLIDIGSRNKIIMDYYQKI